MDMDMAMGVEWRGTVAMNPPRTQHRLVLAVAFAVISLAATARANAADPGVNPGADAIEFNRDIRPILSENCFACHGPDSAARKADLRLDRREVAVELGAIVPKDPEASELVARIDEEDATLR